MRIGWARRSQARTRSAFDPRTLSLRMLRIAPWVVFGPITGVMSEAAIACFRKGRPVLGGLCVALNVSILLAIPILTAVIAAHH